MTGHSVACHENDSSRVANDRSDAILMAAAYCKFRGTTERDGIGRMSSRDFDYANILSTKKFTRDLN